MFSLLPLYDSDEVQNALTPKKFVEEIKNNEALVWGIDQGVADIITTGGFGSLNSKERVRKTSTKEYYHTYSFNLATQEDFSYYNKDNWLIKLNFKSYIKNQRAANEIVKRILDSIKHSSSNSIGEKKQHCDTKQKWALLPTNDNKSAISYKNNCLR
ncbi:hypothetical protein G6F57_011520 [Rhizopus arrhizus]|uniref:Uncharacterized protein n=1 Tax=Rhizopus oryzae TaxID=64495 RepID=A0A9P7BMR1_RHIOR|nr:hypothetical protein G6F24_001674 [Rhizopus arrhizus]KAG1407828.1 hypothetical protein G6F58_009592 [Rhizopus delemar]KAG0788569.1 hypothetical protein G6F22_006966 [Rhizopus arrhizus]KAG0788964.1 hypothetical protein G6F21_006836 [Rhizopus arrhizus]KAG0812678.1 hypothetical protein G6F20_006175 [Rhizopus arrhizus]